MSNVVWRRQKEDCPFKEEDGCEIKPCYNWHFDKNGDIIQHLDEPTGEFWCRSEDCVLRNVRGSAVTNRELWNAYKEKKLRFRVDAEGNPTTVITKTGQVVRSENLTRELYLDAVAEDTPVRSAGGLGPKIRDQRRPQRKRKYY